MKQSSRTQALLLGGAVIGGLLGRAWGKSGLTTHRSRNKLTQAQHAEKIAACKIKQDRKAKARLHCYEMGIYNQPIYQHPTVMRYMRRMSSCDLTT